MMKVQIVQPLVPHYRVSLFSKLADQAELELFLTASREVPGADGLEAHLVPGAVCDYDHKCLGVLGGRVIWQRGLHLVDGMGQGDALVVCGNPRFLSNWSLVWAARRRGVRCVWWGHAFGVRGNKLKNWIRLRMLRGFDAILLYTDAEIAVYEKLGFSSSMLFATNNGVDLEAIDAARVEWTSDRLEGFQRRHDLEGKNLLLFCGRRLRTLDFPSVFRALSLTKESMPALELAIIGPEEGADDLKRLAAELGVEKRVRWVGELFDQRDLAPWFMSARAFLFPGSVGLSLLHAFAYGLPAILPQVTHRPEIEAFEDGVTGLYYTQKDERGLSVCIKSLLSEECDRVAMGSACMDRVSREYNLKAMSERMFEMLCHRS